MNKTQKVTTTAMLVALSVVANAFSIQVSGSNYISFTYIPSFVAGMYLGILPAAAVGFLGDLIAGLLFPKGAYNVLIGIASTLAAVIPAMFFKFAPKRKKLNLLLSLLVCTVVCTSGLNTFALWLLYGAKNGKTFWVYLWARLPFQLLNTTVNGIVLWVLQASKILDKLFLRGVPAQEEKVCTSVGNVRVERSAKCTEVKVALPHKCVCVKVPHRKNAVVRTQQRDDGTITVQIDG